MVLCLFCLRWDGPFTSVEHPIPESAGKSDVVLPRGVVCDPCNNGPLAVADKTFLEFGPVAMLRATQNVRTKRGDPPPPARFANAALTRVDADTVHIQAQSKGVVVPKGDGLTVELVGRRLTPRYSRTWVASCSRQGSSSRISI